MVGASADSDVKEEREAGEEQSESRKRNRDEMEEENKETRLESSPGRDSRSRIDEDRNGEGRQEETERKRSDHDDRDDERRHSRDRRDESRDDERRREDSRRDDGRRDEKRANLGPRADVSNVESSLRFLVPNNLAGCIIGKGGSVISEFQSQSNCKIVLSRTKEFFPHTQERILLLNGTVSCILTALHLILSKLFEEDRNKTEDSRPIDLKIVVPNRICGALIGRGGATIKSFGEDSGATVKMSSQDSSQGAVGERIVTISGTVEQQLRAVALILAKASEDPSYLSYADVPLSYTASGGATMYPPARAASLYTPSNSHPMPGMRSRSPPMAAPPSVGSTTIIVAVPDEHVGAVVGKGGRTLQEITQTSGARIQVSDRGDFVEGTNNRKLTITGPADCVVSAQHLIAQKVQASIQSSEDHSRRGGRDGDDRRGYDGGHRGTSGRDDHRDRDVRRDYGRHDDRDRDRDYNRERDYDRDRDRRDDGRVRDYDHERRDRDRRGRDW